jgi:aminodeoxyfutalosine deaminase
MSVRRYALRAKWVFPVRGEPVENGYVTVEGETIREIGSHSPPDRCVDLGDVALLPALINCHTHLEFSDIPTPLGRAGMPFPEWIGQVVRRRRQQMASEAELDRLRNAAWQQGYEECRSSGVAALGDIATLPWSWERLARQPRGQHTTVFLELLGLSERHLPELLAAAETHLDPASRCPGTTAGLSPHAPYTVHPDLLKGAVALATRYNAPLAMHLAESPEELEILATGAGPFASLLQELGVWQPQLFSGGTRPLDYLRVLDAAPRVLVVHGNYLVRDEMAWLAQRAQRMTVIYCPRTHDYFGHARYPLGELLQRGVAVALGTDSRASNPDLSLMEEMRHVARQFPEVSGADILALGTQRGASALGLENRFGDLAVGKVAELTVVPLTSQEAADPYQLLWEGGPARRLEVDALENRK